MERLNPHFSLSNSEKRKRRQERNTIVRYKRRCRLIYAIVRHPTPMFRGLTAVFPSHFTPIPSRSSLCSPLKLVAGVRIGQERVELWINTRTTLPRQSLLLAMASRRYQSLPLPPYFHYVAFRFSINSDLKIFIRILIFQISFFF